MSWGEMVRDAAAWHRVATPGLAHAHGVGRRTYDRRAEEEGWPQPFPGSSVRLLPGADPDPRERIAAGLAHVGYPAAVTRWSALHILGVERLAPSRIELLVPHERPIPLVRSIKVVRTRKWESSHLRDADGLCCVTDARLITDLADPANLGALRHKAIDLRYRNDSLLGELEVVDAQRGRYRGRPKVLRILSDLGSDGSDSGFEYVSRDRLTELGMPPDAQQAEVVTSTRTYHLDLAWSLAHVGVECQGWRYHGGRQQWQRDIERTNDIVTTDEWAILQLTWDMLWGDPWRRFTSQLRELLSRRTP